MRALARARRSEQHQPHFASSAQLGLADQALILMGLQMAVDLRHRIHGHAHHDEQRGAAEIEGQIRVGDQHLRQQADDRQIGGAENGDAHQHVIDEFRRALARTNAGDEAAMLLQIVGRLRRIEDDRRIEEGEEHDQPDIGQHVERPSMPEIGGDGRENTIRALRLVEIGDRRRQQQQRGGEDRRNDARSVELQRQEGRLPLIDAIAVLPFGIGDQQSALRPLHIDDEGDDEERHGDHAEDDAGRDRALLAELQRLSDRRWKGRDNAREDDQRGAVADAARGDLLAQPHQEHGAADQRARRSSGGKTGPARVTTPCWPSRPIAMP